MSPATAFRSEARFTQKAFRRWIDRLPSGDMNHYELLHGQIVMSPPAGWTHGYLEVRVVRLLEEYVTSERLGLVFGPSTGFDLPSGDTVQPDGSYVSNGRWRERPPTHPNQFVRAVPNILVEILSPTTQRKDRTEKKAIYEHNGVDEYWIVDPPHRSVTVFHLGPTGYAAGRTFAHGMLRSCVLPGLQAEVEAFFRI